MLIIEKLQEAMDATRCKGNTTFLLESSLGTDTQVVFESAFTADLFVKEGYTNARHLGNYDKTKAFALDNSVVYVAIREALELIGRIGDKDVLDCSRFPSNHLRAIADSFDMMDILQKAREQCITINVETSGFDLRLALDRLKSQGYKFGIS